MRYNYRCEETKEIVEREFSLSDDLPTKFEENGLHYVRDMASEQKGFHIPPHMKASFKKGIMRGNRQRPSGKKRFY